MIIGVNHHHLLCRKNESSSPKISKRFLTLDRNGIRTFSFTGPGRDACDLRLLHYVVAQHQHVHSTLPKALERLARRIDDRFTLQVEGGVENDRNPGGFPEALDQPVVPGVALPPDGL